MVLLQPNQQQLRMPEQLQSFLTTCLNRSWISKALVSLPSTLSSKYSHFVVMSDWAAQNSGVTSALAGLDMTIAGDQGLGSSDTY
jgi:hypothetical protein